MEQRQKVLVVGANGQLGHDLIQAFDHYGIVSRGVDLPDFDVVNHDQILSIIGDEKPDCVVNASAYTNVDKAESDQEAAFRVNCDGAGNVAQACHKYNIPMIHISTDYVFDGKNNKPYQTNDEPSPLCVYGMSKEAGEREVRKFLRKHIIIRTAWLYGFHGMNFVKTMVKLGEEREVISVVNDQYGCPTCAADLSDAIATVISSSLLTDDSLWGTYHYTGKGVITWYGFAKEIFRIIRTIKPIKVKEIISIATSDYPTAAKRPAYSVLDCSKFEENMKIMTKPWQKSLETMIQTVWG